MTTWGKAIFNPSHVALVGASAGVGKIGRIFMENLLSGYSGQVYPVHPKDKNILGQTVYPNLKELPTKIDLAVIVTPPTTVYRIIEDCVATGIKAAVIITSGFAETGAEGTVVQDRISKIAKEAGLRLVGPNCFGVVNTHEQFNASLGMALPTAGGISLFTQSGAYGMLCKSHFEDRAAGFAKIFAPGNKADLNETDLVSYFADDSETKVIAMLLESIIDLDAFANAARNAATKKPVVILENGLGVAARRAAQNHTASFAHESNLSDALSGSGVHLVNDGSTLFNVATTLSYCSPQKGSRVAIITNSGGTGVELCDLLEISGLDVPELSEKLKEQLQKVIPAYGSVINPVDLTPDASKYPERYGKTLRFLLACNEIDFIVIVLLQRAALSTEVIDQILLEASQTHNTKQIHVCWDANRGAENNRIKLEKNGIPCHAWTRATAEAIKLCHYIN